MHVYERHARVEQSQSMNFWTGILYFRGTWKDGTWTGLLA